MKKAINLTFLLIMLFSFALLTGCGEKHEHSYNSEVISATCVDRGYTINTCECGESYQDNFVNALGHDIETHNYKEPTCTEEGYETYYTCNRCDYTTYVSVSPTGHSYNEEVVNPTCTEQGYTLHMCKCGDSYKDTYIEATDHTEEIDEAVEPTCTTTGLTEGKHCSVCEEVLVEQEVVEATDHTEEIDEAVEPTCTTTGLTEGKHCSVCEEVLVEQEVLLERHNEVVVEGMPSSCDFCGFTDYIYCEDCDTVFQYPEDLPLLPHDYVNGECINCFKPEGSFGLKYELLEDETYGLAGIGKCEDVVVEIPSFYEGKPVTQILYHALGTYEDFDAVIIPESIVKINSNAFYQITIDKLVIPSSLVEIEENAFSYTTIANIYYNGTIEDWCSISFNGYGANPFETITYAYSSYFEQKVYFADEDGLVSFNGFNYSELNGELIIPSSVENIGQNAFSYLSTIDTIIIEEGVKTIGQYAFQSTSAIEVIMPRSLETIDTSVFSYSEKIEKMTIPFIGASKKYSETTSCFGYLFGGCFTPGYNDANYSSANGGVPKSLKEVTVLSGAIWDQAFERCEYLEYINLEEGVTGIAYYAFTGCINVKRIMLPKSVTSIHYTAFAAYDNANSKWHTFQVYYAGTYEDEKGLKITTGYGSSFGLYSSYFYNSENIDAYRYYESDPLYTDGSTWHYDEEGNIAIWQ